MLPRAAVFEARADEKDPDLQIYGPKMIAKVRAFCDELRDAAELAEELDGALAPARQRFAAAAEESARATAARAAAEAAAAEANTAQARADDEARAAAAAEEVERARAAAESAARPLGAAAGSAPPPRRADEADALGQRPLVAGLGLTASLDLLQSACSDAEYADAMQV